MRFGADRGDGAVPLSFEVTWRIHAVPPHLKSGHVWPTCLQERSDRKTTRNASTKLAIVTVAAVLTVSRAEMGVRPLRIIARRRRREGVRIRETGTEIWRQALPALRARSRSCVAREQRLAPRTAAGGRDRSKRAWYACCAVVPQADSGSIYVFFLLLKIAECRPFFSSLRQPSNPGGLRVNSAGFLLIPFHLILPVTRSAGLKGQGGPGVPKQPEATAVAS